MDEWICTGEGHPGLAGHPGDQECHKRQAYKPNNDKLLTAEQEGNIFAQTGCP